MRFFYIIILCLVLTFILSILFPSFSLGESTANALYTITGIMFSIGLSLTVVSSTSNVNNLDVKKRIRKEIKNTRNHFIFTFLFASIIYILYIVVPDFSFDMLNRNCLLLLVQCFSILYFVYNFIAIQRFNEQIEDASSLL